MPVFHHDFQPEVEEPGCGEDDDQITFRRPLNKGKGEVDVNTEAVKCMKTLAESVAKRHDFTVFGEHIGNQLITCGRNKYEIERAQHLINDICYKLVMGELARPPLPPNFPTQMHTSFVPSFQTKFHSLTNLHLPTPPPPLSSSSLSSCTTSPQYTNPSPVPTVHIHPL